MAIVCSDGGDWLDRALEYHKKSLSIRVNCLGENHPGVADSYHNIADVYSDQGELNKALNYYNKSLSIRLNCFGEDHPDFADSYNNIGNLYKDKCEFDKALNLFNKSLRIRLNFFGENHFDSAASFSNLGYICAMRGHFEIAYEFRHFWKNLEKIIRYLVILPRTKRQCMKCH